MISLAEVERLLSEASVSWVAPRTVMFSLDKTPPAKPYFEFDHLPNGVDVELISGDSAAVGIVQLTAVTAGNLGTVSALVLADAAAASMRASEILFSTSLPLSVKLTSTPVVGRPQYDETLGVYRTTISANYEAST